MTTASAERHLSIDAVRGFAVLGILLMNIVGMGLPSFAYIDPTHAGGATGADFWTWAVNNVLTDGKMRALFTMLFGASTVLIAERATGGALGPAATHYRRMFWLLLFGFAHAVFAWFGDVLVLYALAGLLIFPFRKLAPRTQLVIGVVVLVALLAKNVWQAQQLEALHAAANAPGATAAAVKAWQEVSVAIQASPEAAQADIAGFGGDFAAATAARLNMLQLFYFVLLPTDMLPEAIGQMFVGMALFRMGFFTLGWSSRAYAAMIAVGYLVCVPVTAWLASNIVRSGFDPLVLHEQEVWQQTTRTLIGLAHASVVLLVVRAGAAGWLIDRFAAAGRMAFSNYLMTSIITSLVFCGYGFGLYGQLSRFELIYVVAGVWAFILLWSRPWLEHFHYGPFEWAWRSLVQWKPQRFVKGTGTAAQGAG
ncbi:DUF418 domain-containing protein [Phenylobacterium kunshanense]|uniref:DUF418 domain-containing protein n=1 Tax=Phenylobacterium kunshanense TaxID=1445034 RepID=A0A328B7E6_9CAUL|nr:DUF418 domain-containing protein [Phenylobacterium kunshanense]RAK63043.1 DUF418 domain-containing protein [Phenylobacterium kunshanense]